MFSYSTNEDIRVKAYYRHNLCDTV